MSDIATIWDTTRGDYAVKGFDLQSGDDLTTQIYISLFTDRRAPDDALPPDGSNDRRGWCLDDTTNPIGSLLWLLDRSKRTQDVLNLAQQYAEDALAWMLADGVAARVGVYVEWTRPHMLGMNVVLFRSDGTVIVAANFAWAWNGVN